MYSEQKFSGQIQIAFQKQMYRNECHNIKILNNKPLKKKITKDEIWKKYKCSLISLHWQVILKSELIMEKKTLVLRKR